MRIGFFGGTFDPVHNGHMAIARAAWETGRLDRLLVIPAGRTVHKPVMKVSNPCVRYALCQLAFEDLSEIEILKTEMLRAHGSYTVETVRELRGMCEPDDELFMVCGADILFDIPNWREPEAILKGTDILASLRPGHDPERFREQADLLSGEFGTHIRFFEAEQVDVSSTDVRDAIQAGRGIAEMVPPQVARFIYDAGLYANDDPLEALSDAQQEAMRSSGRLLLALLDGSRLRHSILTMTTAVRMAIIHGVDVFDAALAGLLHDCAKSMPREEARALVSPSDAATLAIPFLYHGPAGRSVAFSRFGIEDERILTAIRYHTTGHEPMSTLDKIIYLADKIEPSRDFPDVEALRDLARTDLDKAYLHSAGKFIEFLNDRGDKPHPDMLAAMRGIERRLTLDH